MTGGKLDKQSHHLSTIETKFLDPTFATKRWAGYDIKTAAAGTTSCGGVALLARKNDWATVENAKVVGTNVLSFELVLNKKERFFVVGCYFPPSDKEGKARRLVEQALRDKPVGSMPLVIRDLNANLDAPWSRRETIFVQAMREHGLECASRHFRVCHGRHLRGRWTWRQVKEGATRLGDRRWVRSRPDYIPVLEAEQKRVKNFRWVFPTTTTPTTAPSSSEYGAGGDSSATCGSGRPSPSNLRRPGSGRRGRRCSPNS